MEFCNAYSVAYQAAGQTFACAAYLPVQMRASPTIGITANSDVNLGSGTFGALSTTAVYHGGTANAAGLVSVNRTFTASADL